MAKIFQSKAYQTIMGYVYGWGAAAVIIGALFKIMHFPGAGAILTVGMLVEAVIFFLSAFEPPMEHYDWTRVFPELSHSAHPLDAATPARGPRAVEQNVQHVQSSTAAPVVATANLNIGLDPSDIEQLKEGIHKIVKSADSFAEATTYVPEFSKKINEVTTSFEKLGNHLGTSAEGFESLNKIVGEQANQMKSQGENYTQHLSALNKNVSALNAIYELQINETKESLEAFKGMQNDMNEMLESVSLSLDNTKLFRQETQQLAKNVASLNSVYGNMLSIVNN